jgi:hypothetical protein
MKYEYNPAQKYILYNHDDPDLHPIVLRPPSPPDYKYIDGYGRPPVEQKWRPLEPSEKLKNLEVKALDNVREWAGERQERRVTEYRVMQEFWKLLEENKALYKEEIEFIKKIHFHLYYGYWVFIYGTPTWLPPTYFRYLNFWYYPDVPGHKPDYRNADWKTYVFKWYCRTTNETLENLDEHGHAQKDENGQYTIVKCPTRTVYGHAKVKRRREGATNQECSDMVWVAERTLNADCPIMADKGDSAEDIFKKYMLVGWLNQPIWLKPVNDTYPNASEIKMVAPPQEYRVKQMGSIISFISTAGEGGIDRRKTHNILSDESAKLTRNDAYRRHTVSKPTTAQGRNIHGYMAYPTTVEEMEEGGGAYRDIWDNSDFYVRDPFKNTVSGLLRIFQPAYEGYDGYIDAWGNSVIGKPTQEQLDYAPLGALYLDGVGAKELLESKISQLLTDGSPAALNEYRQWIRKNPLKVAHCWIGTAGDLGFNTVLLDQRLAELYRKPETVRGNFRWVNNIVDNPKGVEFVQDSVNGRFLVSNLLHGRTNKWTWTKGKTVWDEKTSGYIQARMPLFPMFTTGGADAFDYGTKPDKKTHSMMSDGGIYVMLNYDEQVDGGKEKDQWLTDTTILTYRFRPPSLNEYCEDVIKAMVWSGCMMSVERNKSRLWEYIIDRGYGGYLIYMQNPDGTIEKNPGVWTGQGYGGKDTYFNLARDYISDRIMHEKHPDLIQEMKDIQSPEKLRHFDLLTSFMIARIGAMYGYQRSFKRISTPTKISLTGTQFSRRRY